MKIIFTLIPKSEQDANEINKKLVETNDAFKTEIAKIFLKIPDFIKNISLLKGLEGLGNLNLFSYTNFVKINNELNIYSLSVEINDVVIETYKKSLPFFEKISGRVLTKEKIAKKLENDIKKHATILNKVIE